MSQYGRSRNLYDDPVYDRYDRPGRRYDSGPEAELEPRRPARGPPPVAEMERPPQRQRSSRPQYQRRSSSAGPMVRSRQGEDYEYLPREMDRVHEHEEVRLPPGRRRRSPPPGEWDRDDMFLRRDRSRPPRDPAEDDVYIKRDYRAEEQPVHPPRRRHRDFDREREMEREMRPTRRNDDLAYRSISHERERSRPDDADEFVYSRESRGRGRRRGEEEVIIRHGAERSSSSESSVAERAPPPVHAPPIHQDVITHHKHIEHGYGAPENSQRRGEIDDRELRRRRERNLRDKTSVEINHRREPEPPIRAESPPRPQRSDSRYAHEDEIYISHKAGRDNHYDELALRHRDNRRASTSDIREEANYYNQIATENARMGEAYNGATRDWSIVDVPPGTKRVTMDGVGGGSEEIYWQRYNGVRRAKFIPTSDEPEPEQQPVQSQGNIAKRYTGTKDRREELWTEITKDLVVKEAIEREGHEYEETENFYYVFAYLRYEDVEHLVRVSEDFRRARRDRIREIQRERATLAEPPPRLPALPAPAPRGSSRPWDNERLYEREVTEEMRRPSRLSYTIEK